MSSASADLRLRPAAVTRYPLTLQLAPATRTDATTGDRDTWPGRASSTALTATDHLAEHCRDDLCHGLPCRLYKAGYERGFEDGRIRGQAEAKPEVIYVYVQSGGRAAMTIALLILLAVGCRVAFLYVSPFGNCPRCNGRGRIMRGAAHARSQRPVTCPRCKGLRAVSDLAREPFNSSPGASACTWPVSANCAPPDPA